MVSINTMNKDVNPENRKRVDPEREKKNPNTPALTGIPHTRKKIFIDKSFQTRFIIKFLIILLLGGTISIVLTLMTTQDTVTTHFANSRLVIENTSWAIMPSVVITTLITTLVLGVIAVFVMLLVSHKIAGPMYRFDLEIDRIAKGDLKSPITLRHGDQLKALAESLNFMILCLNDRVKSVKQSLDTVYQEGQDAEIPSEYLEKIRKVKEKIDTQFTL